MDHLSYNSVEAPSQRPLHFFWLALPWLTVGSLIFAEATGFRSWLFNMIPSALSNPAQENIFWGVLLVTFGSSARWLYLRWFDRTLASFASWIMLFVWSSLLTLAHFSVAAGLLFAGCLVVMWSK